jgi:hypothetical protein
MPPRHEPSIPDSSIDPPEISVHSTGTSPIDDDIARLVASACLGHPGLEQPEYARSSSHPSNVPIGTRPRSVTMNTPCRRNLDPSVDFPGNRSPSEAASLLSGFRGLRAPPSTHSSYNPWNKSGTLLEGPGACSNLSAILNLFQHLRTMEVPPTWRGWLYTLEIVILRSGGPTATLIKRSRKSIFRNWSSGSGPILVRRS